MARNKAMPDLTVYCLHPAAGAVVFKQKLSQIATMYQDAKGGFEPKVGEPSRC